jgi:hypothetical protein
LLNKAQKHDYKWPIVDDLVFASSCQKAERRLILMVSGWFVCVCKASPLVWIKRKQLILRTGCIGVESLHPAARLLVYHLYVDH